MLATLAEEADLKKDQVAQGLYTYCATYRFVAAVHLQADILPYLAKLSKLFQKENINFMAIKNHGSCYITLIFITYQFSFVNIKSCLICMSIQVPVTIETLKKIKEAGEHQPEGSFLAQVEEKVTHLNINTEEERGRRGAALSTLTLWGRFQMQVSKLKNE